MLDFLVEILSIIKKIAVLSQNNIGTRPHFIQNLTLIKKINAIVYYLEDKIKSV